MNAVKAEGLHKLFHLKQGGLFSAYKKEVVAVDHIDFEVPSGQSVAFIGPNGAGKSTTIKMLTGILKPTSGYASVLGLVPWQDRMKLAAKIGCVFGQRSQLWLHLPPKETFDLLARVYDIDRAQYKKRRDILIERFALGSFLDRPVRKLSLGQRMRAEIAASLLHRPQLLFLDEPTIGIDVVARQELREVIREWNKEEGVTVFLTSHDAGDIESVAERVIVVNHGRIVLDDDVASVRTQVLTSRVVTVKFSNEAHWSELAGTRLIKQSQHELSLEVETGITSVESVIEKLLAAGSVADISIEAPPLEEVIAHLYQQQAQKEEKSQKTSVETAQKEEVHQTSARAPDTVSERR